MFFSALHCSYITVTLFLVDREGVLIGPEITTFNAKSAEATELHEIAL